MQLKTLCNYCDEFMQVRDFQDYCPNGLQVESTSEVQFIISGVTASLALIEAAIELGADTLLVHHGYFWKNESPVITGIKGQRIRQLIRNNLNLLAYHLPLDAHPEVGNNAQLAQLMGWQVSGSFASVGTHDIAFIAELDQNETIEKVAENVATVLNRKPLVISVGKRKVTKLAWCSGAAQGYIDQAADQGCDLFISGEISENTVHFAREAGIHYIAAGHHATERYGVQALGKHLVQRFGIKHQFIDIDNPV